MSFPTTFANLPGSPSTNPASLLDTMFALCGAMGVIPCNASGTNAITVTPLTNYYLPAAYADYQAVAFVAANSATGAVTIQLGALGFVNLYMPSGNQANSGDINSGVMYIALYNGALNTGAGGFQVFNATTPSVVQPVQGTFKNLKITNGGTPTTQVAVTADQVMLQTSGGGSKLVSSVNLTISTGTTGANGLDAGTVAEATFYAVYVISNGTTTAGLLSTSATSPTLPTGYNWFARVGWVTTASGSTSLMTTLQLGADAQYVLTASGVTTALPTIASGNEGSWTSASLSGIVPTTASKVRMSASFTTGGANQDAALAPNGNYALPEASGQQPPWFIRQDSTAAIIGSHIVEFVLESQNVYWATNAITGFAVYCLGWTDSIGG